MNIILGTAFNYSILKILPFVNSWKKNCNDSELWLVIEPEANESKIKWLKDNGIRVFYFSAIPYLTSSIYVTRNLKYLDILLENKNIIENVFLTDVRDVIFQSNIFDKINNNNLIFFMEDNNYNLSEIFNYEAIKRNYSFKIAEELKNNKISCSGTILGKTEYVINYIKIMLDQGNKKSVGKILDDQAIHNVIAHKNLIQHIKYNNSEVVATLALTDRKEIKILNNNLIETYGVTPSVIHQWDRHEFLVEHLTEEYSLIK